MADIKRRETEARGATTLRDASILGVLAFLQRLEYTHNNGRNAAGRFWTFWAASTIRRAKTMTLNRWNRTSRGSSYKK